MPDNELVRIAVEKVSWPSNDRTTFHADQMAELIASVKSYGVLQPIGVIPDGDGYRGLWGQRRLRAAAAAGLSVVPALIQQQPRTEAEALEMRLCENVQRVALDSMDLAKALDRLIRTSGTTASEVAARLGMSAGAVSRSLSLLRLPPDLQARVGKDLSAAAAYELSCVDDPRRQSELAAAGSLTRDALSGKRKAKAPGDGQGKVAPSRATARLSAGKSVTVVAPSLTMDNFVAVLEDVLGRARQARQKGIALGTYLKMLSDQSRQQEQSRTKGDDKTKGGDP